tara:strand:+ start:361 stop:564 length:204 start_codon:yes stop_codon:yes gene_type:complete
MKTIFFLFDKYKRNLKYDSEYVYSYGTRVAEIKGNELHQLGWWSVTTQKHIHYAAFQLKLKLKRNGY